MKDFTDKQLIEQFLSKKDVSAFEVLYDRYSNKVYGRCLSFTHNEDEAKDYAQEIFIKVLYSLKDLKEGAYFSTWLYTLTYRYCVDKYREKNKVVIEGEDKLTFVSEEDSSEENFIKQLKVESLQKALAILNQEERSILLMKYKDDMEIAQISEVLGIGESAVKMRLKRTRDKLKQICEMDLKKAQI